MNFYNFYKDYIKSYFKEFWFNCFTETLYENEFIEANLKAKIMNATETRFGNNLV